MLWPFAINRMNAHGSGFHFWLILNLGTADCTASITGKTKNGKESGMKDWSWPNQRSISRIPSSSSRVTPCPVQDPKRTPQIYKSHKILHAERKNFVNASRTDRVEYNVWNYSNMWLATYNVCAGQELRYLQVDFTVAVERFLELTEYRFDKAGNIR